MDDDDRVEGQAAPTAAGDAGTDTDEAAASRKAWRRFGQDVAAGDSYGLLLGLLGLLFFVFPIVSAGTWGSVASTFLIGAIMLLGLHTSRVHRWVMRTGIVAVVTTVTTSVAHAVTGRSTAGVAVYALSGFLLIVTPLAVGRRVMAHRVIARETILGAICVYVMLGLMFTYVYTMIAHAIEPAPFFAQDGAGKPGDFWYFSYVTLTTTGYGDLTAADQLGRSLAVLEALIGQLYLATTIARLVGAVGRQRGGPARLFDLGGKPDAPT